jgi:hypothetical protein
MSSKKSITKAPVVVAAAQRSIWFNAAVTGAVALVLIFFFTAETVYYQHIIDTTSNRTAATSKVSKNQSLLSTSKAVTSATLSGDSPASPALPVTNGDASSAINPTTVPVSTISGSTTSTSVSNMATPGQATTLPLQTLTQSVTQAGQNALQAGAGTGGLDPSQF